ncbi:hypothetical protein HN51_071629 [Arachis hypogaea]|uniref:Chromosome transmission fidelity protein n=1 Tax=Arachis hypogaea TaxID=3818 RepID=A0A444YXR0_ARAHY|nr:putative uncharacterized protein DDB_G0287975 [Arachis ipaensis]XP_025656812.1 putative uncharacterized protein DDB_G0287975 [Arachis hypogaea]QHO14240.1 uncharacterized protein DS421_15g522510 [Arachis hypogaea]RYR06721.1 hypothetical protein Ahy_B05g074019 [Arachis hypogaea]
MEIRVRCNCGEDKEEEGRCKEWAIVELQGVVEPQPGFHDSLPNLQIGTLCRPSSQEVYTLTIGYHELTGSKVPLKKPMMVLKKVKHSPIDRGESSGCGEVELQVVGIIRHRILFKNRPKALISKPQPTSKERQKSIMLGSVPSNQAL